MIEHLATKLRRHADVTEEQLTALERAMSPPRTYRTGQEMIRQYSQPGESTLMLSGVSGRLVTLDDGMQQLTGLHIGGDFVDLHSFVLARLDHSVVALTPVTAASVGHPALRRLTEQWPNLGRALWALTVVDAAIHRQWLLAVGRMTAAERTAHLLCELAVRFADVKLGDRQGFELGLTQAAFADALCLSKVHLNRVVQEMRRGDLIRWDGRFVQILDWDRLAALARFDTTYLTPGG